MKIKFIFLLLAFPISAYCQTGFRSTGTTELGGDFGFTSISVRGGGVLTILNSNIFVGYMAAPGFEIGFRPGFTIGTSDAESYKSFNLFLNPAYNFNTSSNVIPYLGFLVGYNKTVYDDIFSHDKDEGSGIGGEAGIKFILKGSSMMLVRFEHLSQKYNERSSSRVNTTLIGIGFRIFLERRSVQKVK